MNRLSNAFIAIGVSLAVGASAAGESTIDFTSDIKPILQTHCTQCHADGKRKGGFSMDHIHALEAGGESGPVVVSRKSAESHLIDLVSSNDANERMPPKGDPLSDDEIAKLWAGFITHDHYDGVREWGGTAWGTPLNQYRDGAKRRLSRLQGRPVLVCQAGDTVDIRQYLQSRADLGAVTFLDVPVRAIFPSFPNSVAIHPHTDRWLLIPSPARLSVRAWVERVLDL